MTSKAAKKRTKQAQRRNQPVQPRASVTTATVTAEPEPKRTKTGIEWMVAKKRLSQRQAKAGAKYGLHFRMAEVDGLDPLRSCLNDDPRGGGGVALLSRPVALTGARTDLLAARQALAFHVEMIAACDLICGRGFTPWEVVQKGKGAQRDAERIQITLGVALDLLDAHYRLTK
jgi:hypothetical protein